MLYLDTAIVLFGSSGGEVGAPDFTLCLNGTFSMRLRKVLGHLPVNLSLHHGACCPWLSLHGFLVTFGIG